MKLFRNTHEKIIWIKRDRPMEKGDVKFIIKKVIKIILIKIIELFIFKK